MRYGGMGGSYQGCSVVIGCLPAMCKPRVQSPAQHTNKKISISITHVRLQCDHSFSVAN